MSKFKPRFTNNASAIPYTDGAMIFDTTTKKLRFDVDNKSYEISSGSAAATTTTTTSTGTGRTGGGSLKGVPDMSDATSTARYLAVDVPEKLYRVTNAPFDSETTSAEFTDMYISKDFATKTLQYFVENNELDLEPSITYGPYQLYRLLETDEIFKYRDEAEDAPYWKASIELMAVPYYGSTVMIMLAICNKDILDSGDLEEAMIYPLIQGSSNDSEDRFFEYMYEAGAVDAGNYIKLSALASKLSMLGTVIKPVVNDNEEEERTSIVYTIPESCSNPEFVAEFLGMTFTNEQPILEGYYDREPYLKWDSPLPLPTKSGQVLQATCTEYKFEEDQIFDHIYIGEDTSAFDKNVSMFGMYAECMNAGYLFVAGPSEESHDCYLLATIGNGAGKNFYKYTGSSNSYSDKFSFEEKTSFDFDHPYQYWNFSQLFNESDPVNVFDITAANKDSYANEFYLFTYDPSEREFNLIKDVGSATIEEINDYNNILFRKKVITIPNENLASSLRNGPRAIIDTTNNQAFYISSDYPYTYNKIMESGTILAYYETSIQEEYDEKDDSTKYYFNYHGERVYLHTDNSGLDYYVVCNIPTRETDPNTIYNIVDRDNIVSFYEANKTSANFRVFYDILTMDDDWKCLLWERYPTVLFYENGEYKRFGYDYPSTLSNITTYVGYRKFTHLDYDGQTGCMGGMILDLLDCGGYTDGFFKLENNDYERVDRLEPDTEYYCYYESEYQLVENLYVPLFMTSTINDGTVFKLSYLPPLTELGGFEYSVYYLAANGIKELVFNKVGIDEIREIAFSKQLMVYDIEDGYLESFGVGKYISIQEGIFQGQVGNVKYDFKDLGDDNSSAGPKFIRVWENSSSLQYNNSISISESSYSGPDSDWDWEKRRKFFFDNSVCKVDIRSDSAGLSESIIFNHSYKDGVNNVSTNVNYITKQFLYDGSQYEIRFYSNGTNSDSVGSGNNYSYYYYINNLEYSVYKITPTLTPTKDDSGYAISYSRNEVYDDSRPSINLSYTVSILANI